METNLLRFIRLITVVNNMLKQTKTLIDKGSVLWFISYKKCDFLK